MAYRLYYSSVYRGIFILIEVLFYQMIISSISYTDIKVARKPLNLMGYPAFFFLWTLSASPVDLQSIMSVPKYLETNSTQFSSTTTSRVSEALLSRKSIAIHVPMIQSKRKQGIEHPMNKDKTRYPHLESQSSQTQMSRHQHKITINNRKICLH